MAAEEVAVAAKECQYFVLSPRQSLESPARRPAAETGDENADQNVAAQLAHRLQGAQAPPRKVLGLAKTPARTPGAAKTPAKTPGSARGVLSTPRYDQQPCLRPSTPTRTKPSRNPSPSSNAGQASARSLPMTPDRYVHSEADEFCDSASMSVYSEVSHMSHESRISRLSRRSVTHKHLGSSELEQIALEEKRREVRHMIKRNQVNCRKALLATDVASAGRALNPTKVTMPQEFGLSTSQRSPRARTPLPEDSCDSGSDLEPGWSTSLRRARSPMTARTATTPKPWRPELTVPKGPELRTTRRLSSVGERSISCPPEEADAAAGAGTSSTNTRPTRASTPEKRRQEVYRAAAQQERSRVASAKANSKASTPTTRSFAPPGRAAAAPRSSGASTTAQERAQRARELAQQRKDQEAQAAKEKHCVFKRGAAAAAPSAATQGAKLIVRPPACTASDRQLRTATPRGTASRGATPRSTTPSSLTPSASAESLGLASTGSVSKRSAKALPARRPSFGSVVERPCCSGKTMPR